jgi:hypothetical protein
VLCLSLAAGEKVRFSDGNGPISSPDAAFRGPKTSDPFGGLLDRDSSVSGVGAVPFSAVRSPSSKAGKARDRDALDKRLDWIRRTTDDIGLSDKNAGRAFGVRDYGLEESTKDPKAGAEAFLDGAEAIGREDLTKLAKDPSGKNPSLAPAAERPLQVETDSLSGLEGFEAMKDFAGPGFTGLSDPARFAGGFVEREHDLVRESLIRQGGPMSGFMLPNARLAPAVRQDRQKRTEEFNKLLGVTPEGGPAANLLGGILDPVNIHPDLTRQGINPVVGTSAKELNAAANPMFSDSLRPLGTPNPFLRPGMLNSASASAVGPPPLLNPNAAPVAEPRKPPQPIAPLIFDMPRRAF